MNATLIAPADEVQSRRKALGWSQNELARRIGRNPGTLSRVLRGLITSSVVWRRIDQVLTRAERRREMKAQRARPGAGEAA